MLLTQVFCNLADILQYCFLYNWTACGINSISLIRNLCLYKYQNNKQVFKVIIVLYVIIGIISYTGFLSGLAVLTTIVQTILAYKGNAQSIRIGAVLIIIFWIFYDYFAGAYVAIALDFIVLINGLLALKMYRK